MTRDEWDARISDIGFGLWVGEVAVRAYPQWLRELGIDTVVSVMTGEQHDRYDDLYPVHGSLTHRKFYADDRSALSIDQIEEIISACGKVTLVHCVSGSNRSTAIALCYLMARADLPPLTAANRYYPARGKHMAATHHGMPQMTHEMETNVARFAAVCVSYAVPRGGVAD